MFRVLMGGVILFALGPILCLAQLRPTIIDAGAPFARNRPSRRTGSHKRPGYELKGSISDPESHGTANMREVNLGVTLWRLQPASTQDSGARMLVQGPSGSDKIQVTQERVASETVLNEGERVRLSVESPRAGYLYVIDQEEYADGTRGDAYVIFPTARTRGGDNELKPGRLIEIPDRDDDPNYFTVKKSRADEVGEILTLVESPYLLPEITPGKDPIRLMSSTFRKWNDAWGGKAQRLEMVGGAGKTWTEQEKEAGSAASGSRGLSADDPLPETIYQAWGKPGAPVMVTVHLRISR